MITNPHDTMVAAAKHRPRECPFGCCLPHNALGPIGRDKLRRSNKRREQRTWLQSYQDELRADEDALLAELDYYAELEREWFYASEERYWDALADLEFLDDFAYRDPYPYDHDMEGF